MVGGLLRAAPRRPLSTVEGSHRVHEPARSEPPLEPTDRAPVERAAGGAAALLGALALVGWGAGVPRLRDFGADQVPMAPSTAVLFVALGGALALRGAARGAAHRVPVLAAVAVVVSSMVLLLARAAGIHTGFEHAGMADPGALHGFQIGHMSVVTALLFLLAGLAALRVELRGDRRTGSGRLGAALGALLLAIPLPFLLAYAFGHRLLHSAGFIPPALNTSLAFAVVGIGLLSAAARSFPPRPEGLLQGVGASPAGFLLLFGALAVAAVLIGRVSYRAQVAGHRRLAEAQLAAIADLKVADLARWRAERRASGAILVDNENFSGLAARALSGEGDAGPRLAVWLARLQEAHGYERVYFTDAEGRVRVSVPDGAEAESALLPGAVRDALAAGTPTFLDLHRDAPGGAVHMSILAPIRAPGPARAPLGAVVMRVDPTTFLYPYLERWPVPSRTAETLLVRREGDEVVFLSQLRFLRDAPLALRRPLSEASHAAARAARGEEGVFEALDYRGNVVLAALHAVPDSPWRLVARMDLAELHAPLEARLWMQVTVVGALLLAGGATLALLWRREVNRFYRERFEAAEALRASEAALQARNDELTRFTYTVSHDLKSPLVTIQTFAGYLARDLAARDAEGTARDLGFIRSAAFQMGRLLDDLLSLSRVGRKANPPEDVPLQAVVTEALSLVAGRVAERGARIDVTDAPIVLRGDRQRLVEVFQNLLDNAVKFSRTGAEPHVEVGVEAAGVELVLFVRDDGVGIDPRHASRLFGLFEKLDASTEGTGIGLALVRRIVEVHGGRIWAESAGPGAGACFRFTLAGTRRAPGGSAV